MRTPVSQTAGLLALSLAMTPLVAMPAAAAQPFGPQELGSLSTVAGLENASALAVNPAALAFQPASELFLSRSVNGLEQTNLFLTGGGFGTAWQQYRAGGRFLNDFRLGAGTEVGGGLSVGGNFDYLQFLDGQSGNSANFGISALYRPNAWFSGGLAIDNLTTPPIGTGSLSRYYRAGVAVRPGTSLLTVSLDGGWQEGDPVTQITPILGLQGEPLPGLMLRGLVDNQLRYSLGLGLSFGQLETGFMSGVTNGRVGSSDVMYMASSDQTRRSHLHLGAPHMAYLRLEGDLADVPQSMFDLRPDYYPGVLHITRRIAEAKADPKITGLVLDLRGVSAGVGKLQEVREAIADFRDSGKGTVAYITDPSMGEYYLATSAAKVVMHPAGTLDIRGVSITVPFFKGVLDKFGVKPQFVGIGKYKSAPEQYMRKGFSEPAREQDDELLDNQYRQMVEAIAKARRLSQEEVKGLVERGLLNPPQAQEKGLVDDIAYPDQIPGLFEKGPANTYPLATYKPDDWGVPDVLAIVNIEGGIARGESAGDLMNGASVGSATVTRALREIRKNDHVKAVVIRVDSPGGDAVASDEIGREIDLLRLANTPVIISMGDVAASGGYWVAANGTRVYAEPGTITGSIGVFTGRLSFAGLLDKIGISTETLRRGEHADMDSATRAMTEAELTLLRDNARYTYGQFLERVAQGRRMSTSRVDELAQGRVWSGARGLDIGLVDKMGGLEAAVADARQASGLDPKRSVIEFYPKAGSLWETVDDSTMDAKLRHTLTAMERYSRVNTWLLAPPVESQRAK